jgi:hypothetical protein
MHTQQDRHPDSNTECCENVRSTKQLSTHTAGPLSSPPGLTCPAQVCRSTGLVTLCPRGFPPTSSGLMIECPWLSLHPFQSSVMPSAAAVAINTKVTAPAPTSSCLLAQKSSCGLCPPKTVRRHLKLKGTNLDS